MSYRTLTSCSFPLLILLLTACGANTPEVTATVLPPTPSLPTATIPAPTPTLSTPPELLETFEYDANASLNVSISSETEVDGIRIASVSYDSPMGDSVPGILTVPAGDGPFPAVMYLHCGHSANCNKAQFGFETVELARRGIASLSIDGPLLRMPTSQFDPESMFIFSVLDLRRGFDYLSNLPEIDPTKFGFVGHSYGATTGGILAGVDTRIRAFVLMAGHAQVSVADGPASIAHLDAVNYIDHASHANIFFQFAEEDLFITHEAAELFYQTASEPKSITWYPTDHDFNATAMYERIEWLLEQLSSDS